MAAEFFDTNGGLEGLPLVPINSIDLSDYEPSQQQPEVVVHTLDPDPVRRRWLDRVGLNQTAVVSPNGILEVRETYVIERPTVYTEALNKLGQAIEKNKHAPECWSLALGGLVFGRVTSELMEYLDSRQTGE